MSLHWRRGSMLTLLRPRFGRLEVWRRTGRADNGKMRAILLSSCGDVTYRRIKDVLSPRTPAEVTFRDICTAMSTHLQPQPSEIVQRFRFNTRVRQPQETIATYVTQLKRLAESCNFGDAQRETVVLPTENGNKGSWRYNFLLSRKLQCQMPSTPSISKNLCSYLYGERRRTFP